MKMQSLPRKLTSKRYILMVKTLQHYPFFLAEKNDPRNQTNRFGQSGRKRKQESNRLAI